MDAIDWTFSHLGGWLGQHLPTVWWSNLLVNGLLAGLSGILVFVPQIMILFGLITILEDTGYMARISFLTDKLMRKVGSEREKRHADDQRFRLCRTGHHERPEYREPERTAADHPDYPADELQRPPAGIYHADRPRRSRGKTCLGSSACRGW